MYRLLLVCTMLVLQQVATAQAFTKGKLLYADDFSKGFNSSRWVAEIAPVPNSTVYIKGGELVLDTKGGVTVWYRAPLKGDVIIEFKRTVLVTGMLNDRLSDMNQFWMANDPKSHTFFKRDGVLESYDSLQLYYVGMGGNTNKTNRFRKYQGNGERTLLQEYTDSAHLLTANKQYLIQIVVKGGTSKFYVDGVEFFSFTDPQPILSGYFGFRSTKSRQSIDDFKVFECL